MSDIPKDGNFNEQYYDAAYFAIVNGKKFKKADGSEGGWGYSNPSGEWHGIPPIVGVWKEIFNLNGTSNKMLDVGCGRGQFTAYARRAGIDAYGFDYSSWAVGNKYIGCDTTWITCHDATEKWLYEDKSFDLIIVLDVMEHLYNDGDIDKVIDELYRVAGKWVFLQIATVPGGGSGSGIHDGCYVLRKGEIVPIELEGMAVAGHVTVQTKDFWVNKLLKAKDKDGLEYDRKKWILRDDMMLEFVKRTPPDVIANWIKNTMIVLEKIR